LSDKVTFGWITQPALFDTPPGKDPRDPEIARDLIEANEKHIAVARQGGFDTIWVEDHMNWGDKSHLECFTNLAWLAGRHPDMSYGTMVCGQAFRNPSLLAKMASNLHLLTGGKFILGLGAGNNPGEHYEYGYTFLPPAERIAQTEEAIRVIRALWTDSPASFEGRHYSIHNAFSSPLPSSIPLMIGGMGEKKLLKLVAQYADWWCADIAHVDVVRHKVEVLKEHCRQVDRDPSEIVHAQDVWISVEDDSSRAVRWDNVHIVAGNPEEVAAELRQYIDLGARHLQIRFMDYPHTAGMERFIERVMPRLG
jgi:alkanesulfonate monooxygenase SsuD/methylene tetrahydromethanopterin reductase-like flavin-dependent oxidoreductase (luciferase family)